MSRVSEAITLLLALFAVACAAPQSHVRLQVTAEPGVSAVDRIEAWAKAGSAGSETISEPYTKSFTDGRDLAAEPWEVELQVSAESAFGASARVVVFGLRAGAVVASAVLQADLAGTDTLDVTLTLIPAGCDQDDDGFQDCGNAACCQHGEDDGFSDCDDANPDATPFAKTEACRECGAGCGLVEGNVEGEVVEGEVVEGEVVEGEVVVAHDVGDAEDGSVSDAVEVDAAPEVVDTATDDGSLDAPEVCQADCTGRECGADGCGGTCGTCLDDGNACNGVTTCVSGTCTQTTAPVACAALDECHVPGTCQAATGACTNPSKPAGSALIDLGDGALLDPASCLVWQKTPPASKNWQAAKAYCEGNQAGLPGSGWHLPDIAELRSLIQGCSATGTGGTCNASAGDCLASGCRDGACDGCASGGGPDAGCYWDAHLEGACTWYWSSSLNAEKLENAWYVVFGYAYVFTGDTELAEGVRCVRVGP